MALDSRALSITGAFNTIKSFFQSQENNSRWKDLNVGSEGNFLMRMLANVIRVISQNVVTGRREVFQETANLLSSQIGIGVTAGSYPTYRGRNQRRQIRFTPNDNMTIPKFTKIGDYNDYGIYTVNDLTFVSGEPQEFSVVIGNLREITWNANTTALKKFVRFEQNISEDVDLLVDGTSMSKENALTKYVKDIIYDKYCILTNSWKSVTISYLNNAKNASHKYSPDTEFTLRYIELEDISSSDFTNEMFAEYGTLETVLTIENFIPFEEVDSIRMNAPVFRETQSLVRSKKDFPDMVRDFVPSVVQTEYEPLTPTYTAVTYLKRDFSLLENFEKEQLFEDLEPRTAFGRPLPDIVNPEKETTTLDIQIGVTNRYNDEASITTDAQSIVDSNYANKLKSTFDKYDLENLLNKLSYAKYSRVDIHTEERTANTKKKIGDYITANDLIYKCTGILGQTNVNEPEWNIPDDDSTVEEIFTGLETTDNNIVWACYKRLNIKEIQAWKPQKKFMLGEFVYSDSIPQYMFKVVDIIKTTGVSEPDIVGVEVGDYVNDGEMVLLCITYNDAYQDRINNHRYRLGDKFNYGGLSFEYIGMTGTTGSAETLTFNDADYDLLALTGSDYDKAYQLDGQTCLYIDDPTVANMVNRGDILRVNLVEQVDKEWEEMSSDELTMNSKLDAKVKEYEDVEEESDEGDDSGDSGSDVTVEVRNFYTGNVIPDISTVELGGSISDGDFTLNRVPYDETYPERISAYAYNNNDRFTITVWKKEVDEETGETTEVVDYAYSFAVVEPIIVTEVEPVSEEPSGDDDDKKEQNANWKELEHYLALEDEIQEWIESEGADKLRCPRDVITFFYEIGRISQEERMKLLNTYYMQYDEYDEHQIYMYMDKMEATREAALDVMSNTVKGAHCHQLKEPIATADSVKQYDEDGNLMYIDTYSEEYDLTVQNAEGGTDTYVAFDVVRKDADNIERKKRTYIYKDAHTIQLQSEEDLNKGIEEVSRVYLVSAIDAQALYRDYNGRVRHVTRIIPATAIAKYTQGHVNISFKKTDDGSVRWEQVTDVDKINYDWNVYANYDINLTVKY